MQIEIHLLGGFEVRVQGQALSDLAWKLRHPRQLLQMLALQPGFRLSRNQVCEYLWPNADMTAASNRLHHTTHLLRALFVQAGVPADQPVVTTLTDALQLNACHDFSVDVACFGGLLEQARRSEAPDQTEQALESAVALYRGELLCGSQHEDWLSAAREQCRLEAVWALDRLASARRTAGDSERAIALLQALITIDVTNETAHRTLMELFEIDGHPDRAVFQYAACERALQRELDVTPSPLTKSVRDRLVALNRVRTTPRVDIAQIRQLPAPYIAPSRAIPMLGRDADLAMLNQWIVSEGARWVTITGAAGLGKTRLAQALMATCQGHFADGVIVVPLTALSRGSELANHLAAALSAGGLAEDTALDRLRQHLQTRHLLVLLDRFEHILDAGTLITDLLAACPDVAVLVTSQVALHRPGERVYPLPSLLAHGAQPATALFCRVAEDRGVVIDQPDELAVVDMICERLNGNALAIELAAGQRQVFNSAQILLGLDRPLELLSNTARDVEAQHRSLKHAIAWSFSLLPDSTQKVLCAVSVFPSACYLDDAVQVLAPWINEDVVRKGMEQLVEHHLVCCTLDGNPGSLRFNYLILDSVGQFARERFSELAIAKEIHAAHARFFTGLARELSTQLNDRGSVRAVQALRRYQTDLLGALKWQEQHGEVEQHGELAFHCAGFALLAGETTSAIDILRPATRPVQNATPAQRTWRAWCLYRLARAHAWHIDRSEALYAIRAARLLAKDCYNPLLQDKIMMQLVVERVTQMRYRTALFHLRQLIDWHRSIGDSPRLVAEYGVLASLQNLTGNPQAAVLSSHQALAHAVSTGLPQLLGFALMNLTEAQARAGDTTSALVTLAQCRALPANAFSVLRRLHLDKLDTIVAFECMNFDAGRLALQSALGRAQSAGRASSKLVIQIMFDFLAVEAGQLEAVSVLPEADLRQLPRNAQLTELHVRLFFYRIRFFSARGQWWLALIALRQAVELLKRSPNAIWRGLLYEACCFALLSCSQWSACRVLLKHSRRSLAAANATPSPRQLRNWTHIETELRAKPAKRSTRLVAVPAAWRTDDARALPQLLHCMQEVLSQTVGPEGF